MPADTNILAKTPTVYLITGSNRGIGLALVRELASNHPDSIIFAGVRSPSSAIELQAIALEHPERIFIAKLVAADIESNECVAREIEEKFGRVDIVISNAGAYYSLSSLISSFLMQPRYIELHGYDAEHSSLSNERPL